MTEEFRRLCDDEIRRVLRARADSRIVRVGRGDRVITTDRRAVELERFWVDDILSGYGAYDADGDTVYVIEFVSRRAVAAPAV